MSVLYPRLLPGQTNRLFDGLRGATIAELTARSDTRSDRAVYAAGGGTRVTKDDLTALRSVILTAASGAGFPEPPVVSRRAEFDLAVAQHLHEATGMAPGEASQPQVWAFLGLVLMPDICAWRFPANASGDYVADRFKGSDLTRHTFARLWTRAHVLREDRPGADPYELLGRLGEADIDNMMARRDSVAASPALVRAVVRTHARRQAEDGSISDRMVIRDLLKRLLRLSAFIDFDGHEVSNLDALVRTLREESRLGLTVSLRTQSA